MNVLRGRSCGFRARLEIVIGYLNERLPLLYVVLSEQLRHPDLCLTPSVHDSRKNKTQANTDQSRDC